MTKRTSTSLLDPLVEIQPMSEDPTRRALQAKRGELGTRLEGLNARQGKIEQRISLRVSNQAASVHRLLENPMAEVDLSDGLHEEHQKVRANADIVRRALVALDAQIGQQEAERDGWACSMLKLAHRANVRATLSAQIVLHRAVRQQESIREGLVGKGYSRTSHLVPHFHHDFRFGLGDPNTWLSADLRTARDEGFLSEAERKGRSIMQASPSRTTYMLNMGVGPLRSLALANSRPVSSISARDRVIGKLFPSHREALC